MNIHLIITLAVLLLMIIGFLCGKFKLGLVAMTASTVLCLTGACLHRNLMPDFAATKPVL